MEAGIKHHDPNGLHQYPGCSKAVTVAGNVETIYVGGRNAVDASGAPVGEADIGAQSKQVIRTRETALIDPRYLVEIDAIAVVPQG